MNTALKTTTLQCNIDGKRLDVYISDCVPALTRSAAARLVENGKVTSNGALLRKNHKTSCGEAYLIVQDEPEISAALPQDIRLDVVFEDTDIIVVNKPRGMVVHPAPGHFSGTLVNALLSHCGDSLSGIGGVLRPGIVHRLDKDTSGLIIAAKNDISHLSLTKQLAARTLVREYEAVVCGNIKTDSGTVDASIGRHPADRKKQAVFSVATERKSRNAVTHYTVITRYGSYTHVSCRLETGRTHQIRVHLAHVGHPVLGDRVYGRKKAELGMDSQCLHARRLCFMHPSDGRQIELCADLPDYFNTVLARLDRLV